MHVVHMLMQYNAMQCIAMQLCDAQLTASLWMGTSQGREYSCHICFGQVWRTQSARHIWCVAQENYCKISTQPHWLQPVHNPHQETTLEGCLLMSCDHIQTTILQANSTRTRHGNGKWLLPLIVQPLHACTTSMMYKLCVQQALRIDTNKGKAAGGCFMRPAPAVVCQAEAGGVL